MYFLHLFLCGNLLLGISMHASELVPFSPPWDDTDPGPTSMNMLLHKPAGRHGNITVKDGRLYLNGKRQRLFGVNVTAGGCFPDHETAGKTAARMAKFGINAARFHFLDSTWGKPRLIDYDSGSSSNWNSNSLDRLDYFISELKKNGIYINLNLLVGKKFGVGDGVDPSINNLSWKAAHAVGFFNKQHLASQKSYARQLLLHKNSHTGKTYAEDPAIAIIEINNENGLLHTWMSGAFDSLPKVFADDLQKQWNSWLGTRYKSHTGLVKAWKPFDKKLGPELLLNTSFSKELSNWYVEQHQGAEVNSTCGNGKITLNIGKPGTASWHIQLNQRNLDLNKGNIYTLNFKAAADRKRKISVYAMQAHEPWRNLGLNAEIELDSSMKDYSFTFKLEEKDENARVGFSNLSQANAAFTFSNISLREGGRLGLLEGESLDKKNMAFPRKSDSRAFTEPAKSDWISFLWETEKEHWQEMRRYLKRELGVKALVTGTIIATSSPNMISDMDIIDTHAYWQHPHFPGKPWDRGNWTVKNISMLNYPKSSTLAKISLQRVKGKPHMVSEYNHPAPNTHAGEGPLLLSAYACLQDWDALFMYTYAHDEERLKAGKIPDFFDIAQHPAIMANLPTASCMFLRNDISPAEKELLIPFTAAREKQIIMDKGRAWNVAATDTAGPPGYMAFVHRIALSLDGKKTDKPIPKEMSYFSDTGQLSWLVPEKNRGRVIIRSPRAKGIIGSFDESNTDLGNGISVKINRTRGNWCILTLVSLDGNPLADGCGHLLITASGCAENTDMGWKNKEKSTVGKDWGKPPSLLEPINAEITIPCGGKRPQVFTLDETGQRKKQFPPEMTDKGAAVIKTGIDSGAIWHEVVLSSSAGDKH